MGKIFLAQQKSRQAMLLRMSQRGWSKKQQKQQGIWLERILQRILQRWLQKILMKIQKNCPQPAIIPKEKYIPPEKQ